MRVYSEGEIQDLLRRAAALQAARRDPSHGLTLDEIRHAAKEAGIDPEFVDAAARGASAEPKHRTDDFWGGESSVLDEMLLDHAVDDDEWARMVAEIRRSMGEPGRAEEIGRSREWRWEMHGLEYGRVTLTPRGARTHVEVVRLNQSGSWHLLPMTLGLVAFVLGVLAAVGTGVPAVSAVLCAMLTLVSFAGARALYGYGTRAGARKNARLLDRLALIAGEGEGEVQNASVSLEASSAPLLDHVDDAPAESEGAASTRHRTR
jgi:hypothetical protein